MHTRDNLVCIPVPVFGIQSSVRERIHFPLLFITTDAKLPESPQVLLFSELIYSISVRSGTEVLEG